jgi:hypothetical protein
VKLGTTGGFEIAFFWNDSRTISGIFGNISLWNENFYSSKKNKSFPTELYDYYQIDFCKDVVDCATLFSYFHLMNQHQQEKDLFNFLPSVWETRYRKNQEINFS